MKVLFIGGTGIISSACSNLALQQGLDLYHFNRGKSSGKINGVKNIVGDIRNIDDAKKLLAKYEFDVVVDWISFTAKDAKASIELFRNKTKQFIFISSASAYQTPPQKLPVTEETPLNNPFWQYSRDKIACENIFIEEYKNSGFPSVIVRPSHTYNKTMLPIMGGYTTLQRMKEGKEVIIIGDGTSIWTLTHHADFAVGLNGLFGNEKTIGEAFHITSDEWLTWNQIFEIIANEFGYKLKPVHIPSDFISKYDKNIGDGLLGDKMHSMIFDNSKIKKFVPEFNCKISFEKGVKDLSEWYLNNDDKYRIDDKLNDTFDKIIRDFKSL